MAAMRFKGDLMGRGKAISPDFETESSQITIGRRIGYERQISAKSYHDAPTQSQTDPLPVATGGKERYKNIISYGIGYSR